MMTPPLAYVASRKSARPGVGAIRKQSRESRVPEKGRWIMTRFLDTDKVNRMGRKKVKQFSAPGSETASIPLKNLEGVRGGRGSVEGARCNGESHNVTGKDAAGGDRSRSESCQEFRIWRGRVVSTLDGHIWSKYSIKLAYPARSHFQRTLSKERWVQGWDERYRS